MTNQSVKKDKAGRPAGSFGVAKMEAMTEAEAKHALYRGITVADAEIIFKMDRRTILAKVPWTDLKPSGQRNGRDLFHIRDLAPYLVKPAGDIEEYIKRMRPQDLPALVSKEYWNGRRAKLAFLESNGDLWRTDKVAEAMSEVIKIVRMGLLLMPDSIDRESPLSVAQRDALQKLIDQALETMRKRIVETFGNDLSVAPGSGDDETPDEDDTFYVPPKVGIATEFDGSDDLDDDL